MTDTTYKSEQLSFWQLIREQKNKKIEIPIIQRDYAQGRADKVKVRDKFLSSLVKALSLAPIELDFVYGSDNQGSLQPLDGQQRLTTLFLLHWYVATKESVLDREVKETLKKFTYTTRTSSRSFCECLVEKGISISPLAINISDSIKNAAWFYLSWQKDPTIKAMLIMLDAIHAKFKTRTDLWPVLIDNQNRPITFHYIGLADFGLSDDLYIKMNARGKQLSPFENFKADFIKHIANNNWDDDKGITETFSHKADTSWTDVFWDNGGGEATFDIAFINFIANAAINALAVTNIRLEDKEKRIQQIINNAEVVIVEDFDHDGYNNLYNCFNIYTCNANAQLKFNFPLWNWAPEDGKSLFAAISGGKATYSQRVLFYAQTAYLLSKSSFNKNTFNNWMRVVRNIVINSTIDSAASYIGAINLINELAKGSDSIYDYLLANAVQSNFASAQTKEEVKKAKFLTNENKNAIFGIEDTNFCKGRLEFAFYVIDDNLEMLGDIQKIIKFHLDGSDISNQFRRALLTIEDHQFYYYIGKWTSVLQLPKHCLIKNINDLKDFAYRVDFRDYLKILMLKLIKKELKVIIDDFLLEATDESIPNWKLRIIKDPKLLDNEYFKSRYISVPYDEKFCYLLRVERPRDKESCKKIR